MDRKGFSLIELLIVASLSIVVAIGITTVVVRNQKSTKEILTKTNLISLKQQIAASIQDNSAWQSTVSNNSTMSCLTSAGTNCPSTPTPFKLYQMNGNVLIDGTSATSGYNLNLLTCNTFAPSGTNDCAFHYEITWRASCTNCAKPTVHVTAELKKNRSSYVHVLNVKSYQVDVTRSGDPSVANVAVVPASCGAGEAIVGISTEGVLICGSVGGGSTPPPPPPPPPPPTCPCGSCGSTRSVVSHTYQTNGASCGATWNWDCTATVYNNQLCTQSGWSNTGTSTSCDCQRPEDS